MVTTQWRIWDGANQELRGPWIDILSTDGWENIPGFRGEDLRVPGVDGAIWRPNKPRDVKEFELPVVIFGVDRTTGLVTTSPPQHIRDNLDHLFRLLNPILTQVQIRKVISTDPEREILCQLADGADVGPYQRNPLTRAIVLRFTATIPYWRTIPALAPASPPTFNPGGNAPVTDAVITFTGGSTPRLTNTSTGDWIELSGSIGSPVTVDVGARTVTQGGISALNLFTRLRRRWMIFRPVTNNLTLTGGGSVSIDAYTKWHS